MSWTSVLTNPVGILETAKSADKIGGFLFCRPHGKLVNNPFLTILVLRVKLVGVRVG